MNRNFYCLSALSLVLLCHGAAAGSIINVTNFQFDGARTGVTGPAFTGNGVLREDGTANNNPGVGTTSGTWNSITFDSSLAQSQSSGFLNSAGASTNTTVSITNLVAQDSCDNCNDAQPSSNLSLQPLLNSYIITGNSAVTAVTIGHLPGNALYDVYVYGTNGATTAGGSFSINGSPFETTSAAASSPFTTYTNGADYVLFQNVRTDASGNLIITSSPASYSISVLNGVQIGAVVPEPSSVALLGVSGVGMLFVAARRLRRVRA